MFDALTLLARATEAIKVARFRVDKDARISHVGFRSRDAEEWQTLLEGMKGSGRLCMTFKPDGRRIPFIRLDEPLVVGADVLKYIELPENRSQPVHEPMVLIVFQHSEHTSVEKFGDYDIRQQAMHAEDFIARDAARADTCMKEEMAG